MGTLNAIHCSSSCLDVCRAMDYAIEPLEQRVQLSVSLLLSGTQTITPGSAVNATADANRWETEMSVVVNPTNPLNLAGFMHKAPRDNDATTSNEMGVVYSTDGGATWTTNLIDQNDDGLGTGTRGDPTIVFDDEGRLYVGYGFVGGAGIFLKVAVDAAHGGASFEQFTTVDSGVTIDKWIMTAGIDPITDEQAVYIAYKRSPAGGNDRIVVAGSNDGGSTFTTPVTVDDSAFTSGTFACPAVTPDGELYVSWRGAGAVYIDKDPDGLFDEAPNNDFGDDLAARTLSNGALSFYTIPAQPDRGIPTGPVLAVDRSGGNFDGRLYVVFVERASTLPEEDDTNIMLAYSDDGTNWFPVTVDATVDSSEFLPWVDVDQATGSVNVLYYTTDGDQSTGNDEVKMRLATSLNGGADLQGGGSSWTLTNLTTILSDENEDGNDDRFEDSSKDYTEYLGLDVHQGTAHGLFAFEPFGTGADQYDLEALHVDAAFVSASNTLTINGDDTGTTNDTIVVQPVSSNTSYLEVLVNSVRQFAGRAATIGKIVINGLNGNDTITVSSSLTIPTTINGGDGNDTITGGAGTDSITGGGGNDVINGGDGVDTLLGGGGTDTLDYGTFASSVTINLTASTAGPSGTLDSVPAVDFENAIGGSGNDLITGNLLGNVLDGRAGADTIDGDDNGGVGFSLPDGDDYILGGDGNDSIVGDGGHDVIDGQSGDDYVNGGPGNDEITGGYGSDQLLGDSGHDDFYSADATIDTLWGGDGDDTALIDVGTDLIPLDDIEDVLYGTP